jgi:exoribonuclease-2
MEDRKVVLALVLNHSGPKGKFEVITNEGKSCFIKSERILVSSPITDPGDSEGRRALLEKENKIRDELCAQVDLPALWSLAEEAPGELDWKLLAGLNFGREEPPFVSAILRAVQRDGLWFDFSPAGASRRDLALVERIREEREKNLERLKLSDDAAKWLEEAVNGRVAFEPEGAEKIKVNLRDFLLFDLNGAPEKEVKEILKKASLTQDREGAFKALVALGEMNPNENLALLRLGFAREFTPEIEQEAAELLSRFDLNKEERLDLTKLDVLTVDAQGAREFDDALSLENLGEGRLRLGLHIADVSAIVPQNCALDIEASQRCVSMYLPEARYPMLPEKLTSEIISLKADEVRPAFSLLVEISKEGDVLSHHYKPSLIKVSRQMSFEEAETALIEKAESQLTPLWELSRELLKKRIAKGGQNVNLPELWLVLNSLGQIEATISWPQPKAGLMVGELMILANSLAAQDLNRAGWACPYRYQLPPAPPLWTQGENPGPMERLAYKLHLRRLFGRGGLTLDPNPHGGLGVELYTSVTSPMRRYLDLLVSRQLKALSQQAPPPYDREKMMELSFQCEKIQKAVKTMTIQRQRFWLAKLLSPLTGREFKAVVFERIGKRALVCLTDYMLETLLFDPPPEARPGREVVLKLKCSENRLESFIDFRGEDIRFEYVSLA